jgi:hypothetical protein
MTDLQDAILDRLVGTRIGMNWPDGPLTIAAEVVGGGKPIQFGVTDNDRGAKREIARRLGYPILLIEAIQGANRGFFSQEDRRSFALAIFQHIAVAGHMPVLSSAAQNHIAARLAIRAHPYVCVDPACPVPKMLDDLLLLSLVTQKQATQGYDTRCATADKTLRNALAGWLTPRSTKIDRLLQTAAQVIHGLVERKSMGGWCSIRESVRLAASERGLEEAIDCCKDIAQQCGLVVS